MARIRFIPFDFCDECPDGKDQYPIDELSHFGDDRLCRLHASMRTRLATWYPGTLDEGDNYDRLTKCQNDKDFES